MNRLAAAGGALLALGLAGYAVGLFVDVPARAFAVTAVMVGITLIAVRAADSGVNG